MLFLSLKPQKFWYMIISALYSISRTAHLLGWRSIQTAQNPNCGHHCRRTELQSWTGLLILKRSDYINSLSPFGKDTYIESHCWRSIWSRPFTKLILNLYKVSDYETSDENSLDRLDRYLWKWISCPFVRRDLKDLILFIILNRHQNQGFQLTLKLSVGDFVDHNNSWHTLLTHGGFQFMTPLK